MMNQSDIQLIELFTQQKDQSAFEQLVNRYVDVAYSAAVTRLGTDDLARDACQLTFLELARKAAGLSEKVKLGGWVYTTSRNISWKIQRGEMRRMKREQDYAEQMKMQNSPELDWSRLAPEIHEALDRLKPADRDPIILRYFQHKSLAETGSALGLSADAARMRLNRALERLNKQLGRKGITSTAAALAAALPAHAAHAAPAGLAKSISITALAKAGAATLGLSTATGIGIMTTKTLIISASVAATTLIGGTVYLANRPADTTGISNPSTEHPASNSPIETGQKNSADGMAQRSGQKPSSSETGGKDQISGVSGTAASFDPRAAIGPEKLKTAEQLLEMLSLAMSMGGEGSDSIMVMTADGMTEGTDVLVKKLALRLGLSPEQESAFTKVLEENREAITGGIDMQDILDKLLEADRKKAAEFLAIHMLDDQSMENPELASYAESLTHEMADELGFDPEAFAREPVAPWDKNDEVLEKLSAQLTPDQQTELLTYIEEQALREKEGAAYERSRQIANQLGLNEEDRSALYDYLYDNPDATHQDIKDNLAPELHELMREPSHLESILSMP